MAGEGLGDRPDRRRQRALEERVVLGEAEPAAAGRGDRPDRQPLPLGERDGVVPAAGRVDVGAGDQHRVGRGGERRRRARATAAGAAPERGLDRARDRVGGAVAGASAVQSSIGIETKAGPFGAIDAVWIARPIAAGTSSARGGS